MVALLASEGRGEVVATRIEEIHAFHGIFRTFFLPFGRHLRCFHTVLRQFQQILVGQRVDGSLEVLPSLLVVACLHQLLGQSQVCQRVGLLVADHVFVGGDSFVGIVDFPIALRHLRT